MVEGNSNEIKMKIALLEKSVEHLDPELGTKVAVLEKEVSQWGDLLGKFDLTIDRLSEVSNSLEKLAVVHEARLNQQEKKTEEIVENMNKEIKQLMEMMKQLAQKEDAHYKDLSDRMHVMEKWKWMIMGGALVIATVTSKLDLSKLFTLFTN